MHGNQVIYVINDGRCNILNVVCDYNCPPFSIRQHLSYDGCLEVRRKIIRTVLCYYCILMLHTVISTLR